MGALLALAGRDPDAVIPGYTHLRRAQAVLWPHYLLAYFEMFARDAERFASTRARQRPAARLRRAGRQRLSLRPRSHGARPGLRGGDAHSMDVSADRDFVLDFVYAASGRCSTSAVWPKTGFSIRAKSSAGWTWRMPSQRLEPHAAEEESRFARTDPRQSGRVMGCLVSSDDHHEGLPMTYNRDMQEERCRSSKLPIS